MDIKSHFQWQFTSTGVDASKAVIFPISFQEKVLACTICVEQGKLPFCEGGGFSTYNNEWTLSQGRYACWTISPDHAEDINNDIYIIIIGY